MACRPVLYVSQNSRCVLSHFYCIITYIFTATVLVSSYLHLLLYLSTGVNLWNSYLSAFIIVWTSTSNPDSPSPPWRTMAMQRQSSTLWSVTRTEVCMAFLCPCSLPPTIQPQPSVICPFRHAHTTLLSRLRLRNDPHHHQSHSHSPCLLHSIQF